MVWNATTQGTEHEPTTGPPARVDFEARPMIYVVRYCGAQASSIGVAISQAIAVLDNYLQQSGYPQARQLFVTYRNHIEGAVTLQVGYPVEAAAAASVTGEIFAGSSPAGPMVELSEERTLEQILAVGRTLPEKAASYTWQVFEENEFRPWTGKLVENLLVPLDFLPGIQRRWPNHSGGA